MVEFEILLNFNNYPKLEYWWLSHFLQMPEEWPKGPGINSIMTIINRHPRNGVPRDRQPGLQKWIPGLNISELNCFPFAKRKIQRVFTERVLFLIHHKTWQYVYFGIILFFPPASKFAITLNMTANALETKLITISDSGLMLLMQTIDLRVFPYFLRSKRPHNHGPCCRSNLRVTGSRLFHLVSKLLFSTLPESKRATGNNCLLGLSLSEV